MNETQPKQFETIIQQEGDFIFIAIPFSPREAWGAQSRYAVTGTINDIPVRGTLGALRQDYFLRLAKSWMRENKMETGAKVTAQLTLEIHAV